MGVAVTVRQTLFRETIDSYRLEKLVSAALAEGQIFERFSSQRTTEVIMIGLVGGWAIGGRCLLLLQALSDSISCC